MQREVRPYKLINRVTNYDEFRYIILISAEFTVTIFRYTPIDADLSEKHR